MEKWQYKEAIQQRFDRFGDKILGYAVETAQDGNDWNVDLITPEEGFDLEFIFCIYSQFEPAWERARDVKLDYPELQVRLSVILSLNLAPISEVMRLENLQ